jgi:antirestriction protein ArdC
MRSPNQESLHKYTKEELVAELSSYFVGAELGIPYDSSAHENHAAYLKSWISALEDPEKGKQFFSEAVKEASASADFQISRCHEKLKALAAEKTNDQEKGTVEPTKAVVTPLPQKEVKASKKEKEVAMTR